MPLNPVNNGDAASVARATINTAISQIDTNTTALTTKQPLDADLTAIAALSPSNNDTMQYISGTWKAQTVIEAKTTLALENVDNTSDANKPVSTATQTALDLKQNANGADTTIWRVTNGIDSDQSPTVGDNKRLYVFENTLTRTFTIPSNSNQAFSVGTEIRVFNSATSTNDVQISGAAGVTVLVANGATLALAPQTAVHIIKIATDTWAASY